MKSSGKWIEFFTWNSLLLLSPLQSSKIYSLVVQGEEKLHCIFEDIKQEESKAKTLEEVIKVRENLYLYIGVALHFIVYLKRLETEKVTSVESLKFLNQVEKQRLLLQQRRLQMSRKYWHSWFWKNNLFVFQYSFVKIPVN